MVVARVERVSRKAENLGRGRTRGIIAYAGGLQDFG